MAAADRSAIMKNAKRIIVAHTNGTPSKKIKNKKIFNGP